MKRAKDVAEAEKAARRLAVARWHATRRLAAAAVTAAAVLGLAGPVAAAPKPKIDLVLSYMSESGYAAAVVLTCDPVGGVHPKAVKACAALKKTGGNPGRMKPAAVLCTLEYAPITAQLTGTWKGKKVRWSKSYPNPCDLARTTGVVFAF
jgi:hypothetical protein